MIPIPPILAIDIGAGALKIAEFRFDVDGKPTMTAFMYREFKERLSDRYLSPEIPVFLKDFLGMYPNCAKHTVVGFSSLYSFARYVKLPPFDHAMTNRKDEIILHEVRQNIPFDLEVAAWGSKVLEPGINDTSGCVTAVLGMMRIEFIKFMDDVLTKLGLQPVSFDLDIFAGINAAAWAGVGRNNCELVVDIGASNTQLTFIDGRQVFTRSVPIGGYTITQRVHAEFSVSMEQSEELKRRHGFCAMGGNYADATTEMAFKISKCVRTVMTRLHTEIVRSINAWRSTQNGRKPIAMYLTGGSSGFMYTDKFFEEKLLMPVSYLNVLVDREVDIEPDATVVGLDMPQQAGAGDFEEVSHMFTCVVGLAHRIANHALVDVILNATPPPPSQQAQPVLTPDMIEGLRLVMKFMDAKRVAKGSHNIQDIWCDIASDTMLDGSIQVLCCALLDVAGGKAEITPPQLRAEFLAICKTFDETPTLDSAEKILNDAMLFKPVFSALVTRIQKYMVGPVDVAAMVRPAVMLYRPTKTVQISFYPCKLSDADTLPCIDVDTELSAVCEALVCVKGVVSVWSGHFSINKGVNAFHPLPADGQAYDGCSLIHDSEVLGWAYADKMGEEIHCQLIPQEKYIVTEIADDVVVSSKIRDNFEDALTLATKIGVTISGVGAESVQAMLRSKLMISVPGNSSVWILKASN